MKVKSGVTLVAFVTCKSCKKIFKNRSELKKHDKTSKNCLLMKTRTVLQCSDCPFQSENPLLLQMHEKFEHCEK